MKCFYILSTILLSFTGIKAQQPDTISLKDQIIKDWQRAKAYTNEYLEAMPADKYNVRPVDSIRSFSEQMLHLAQGTISLVSNGSGKERIFPGRILERSKTAHNKDSVAYYVNASYDYAISALQNADSHTFNQVIKRGNFSETRLAYILKAFEHQTHHRGQATIYIRLQGIRPPAEKLF